MKNKLSTTWALAPATQRREPTGTELATGFPCGPADQALFNELFFRNSQSEAELVNFVTFVQGLTGRADLVPSEANLEQLRKAIQALIALSVRQRLQSNITLWVRSDGNDANDGSANTPQSAYKTILGAWAALRFRFEGNGYTVTIRIGLPGTYEGGLFEGYEGTVIIRGDLVNRTDYVLVVPTGASGSNKIAMFYGTNLTFENVRFRYTAANIIGLHCLVDSFVTIRNVAFEVATAATGCTDIYITAGGTLYTFGTIELTTDGVARTLGTFLTCHHAGIYGGSIANEGCTITNVNRTYATAFMFISTGVAVVQATAFSGTAAGTKYAVYNNGVINTAGAGINYLPGSVAGVTGAGGEYV